MNGKITLFLAIGPIQGPYSQSFYLRKKVKQELSIM